MNTLSSFRNRGYSDAAEHQMRSWALRLESQAKLEHQQTSVITKPRIFPYVAVSRESGVDAAEVARLAGAKLAWKVLDRGLLDYMAEHYHWSRIALEYVDERTASWFHDTFGKWLDEKVVSQPQYVSRLGRIVLMAAQHESTVIVGRGAQFVLPRDRGVSVRIIDLKQQRIKRIIERRQLSPAAAEKFIDDTDKGRADFVWRYFHRDVADPHLYDLVINLEHASHDEAAELIRSVCHNRFPATTATPTS